MPDSLTRVFHTKGGREVKDGAGIMPDIEVKSDSLPNIAYYLIGLRDSNEVVLNYEVDYIAKHPTIAPAESFQLTDADYEEFKQRVLDCDFQYDRETEKYLKDLVRLAKGQGPGLQQGHHQAIAGERHRGRLLLPGRGHPQFFAL